MRSPTKRRTAALALLGLTAGLLPVLLGAAPASAGTVTTPNSCTQNVQAGTSALSVTLSGDGLPNPAVLGVDTVTVSNATLAIDVPGAILVAGYNLGLLTVGVNNIPANITVHLLATGAVETDQTVGPVAVVGTTTISDPDGAPGTGDESATDLSISTPLPSTSWTPTGGPLSIRLGNSSTTATVGVLNVTFSCTPGTPTPAGCGSAPLPPCTGTNPVAALPFTTVTVNAPATAPVCVGESLSVGITQSIPIDLTDNCTDVNGDIDPSTFVVSTPSAGSLSGSNGVYTYTAPATDPGAPVTIDFTVADAGGLVSNTATVSITILANSCDASAAACSLTEIVVQPVVGTTMTLDKVAGVIMMSTVVLNGQPQASSGSLQDLTVINARGTAAGWTVSGFVTDIGAPGGPTVTLPTGQTVPSCSAAGGGGSPHRLCIPGDNMGWSPTAAVAHDVIPGDVAQVNAGPADAADAAAWLADLIDGGADGIGGLGEVNVLCASPDDHSGGTFACDASLFLGVPASAGAGTYNGGLVLTLV